MTSEESIDFSRGYTLGRKSEKDRIVGIINNRFDERVGKAKTLPELADVFREIESMLLKEIIKED